MREKLTRELLLRPVDHCGLTEVQPPSCLQSTGARTAVIKTSLGSGLLWCRIVTCYEGQSRADKVTLDYWAHSATGRIAPHADYELTRELGIPQTDLVSGSELMAEASAYRSAV